MVKLDHVLAATVLLLAAILLLFPGEAGRSETARPQGRIPHQHPFRLRLEQVVADSASLSFNVNSVLIIGPTEVLLYDAQYRPVEAARVAARIAETGKRLKAIFISHPDHDHYTGAATIVERFPGTSVFMTPVALEAYNHEAKKGFEAERSRMASMPDSVKRRAPVMLPDSLVTVKPLEVMHFTVDGERIEVLPDLQGDVLKPLNSALWIPSLRAVIAGDVVFNGVHPWLAASTAETRAAWLRSLQRLADLKPLIVIAGHKPNADVSDSPDVIQAMAGYLRDFDATKRDSHSAEELVGAMMRKYPRWKVPGLLRSSARKAFKE